MPQNKAPFPQNTTTSPHGLIAMSCVLPVICTGTIGLRFWVRSRQPSSMKLDDWMMLPALLFFIGMCVCAILGVHSRAWGFPTPDPSVDYEIFHKSIEYEGELLEAFQFIQILALGCIKLGALFFYRRIFGTRVGIGTFTVVLRGCIAVVILWTIAMTLMNALQCGSHITALWAGTIENYLEYCIYTFPFVMGFAISNFLLDLLILVLPMKKIWGLNASRGAKLGLFGVFGLATIGFVASVVRMAIYIEITVGGPWAHEGEDSHLVDTEVIFWSNLEAGLCLVAVNLPSLKALKGDLSAPASDLVASLRSRLSLSSLRSPAAGDDSESQAPIRGVDRKAENEWHKLKNMNKLMGIKMEYTGPHREPDQCERV